MQGFGAEQWLSLLTFISLMSFTPGPNTMLSSALAANYGIRRAMTFIISVPVGWVALLWLCAAGVGIAVKSNPWLSGGIKGFGVAYMLWLAWKIFRSHTLVDRSDAVLVGFWQGAMLQFVNIKAWFGALTITSAWIATAPDVVTRTLILTPVFMAFAFASNFTYAFVGASLRLWLLVGQRLQWFNAILALALTLTAFWMLRL